MARSSSLPASSLPSNNSTQEEYRLRADRLKLARKLTNLTLDEIPEKFGISKHTFYAWESGRNPIKEKMVSKIIHSLRQAGIYCTAEWLLFGTGLSPRFMHEVSQASDTLLSQPEKESSVDEFNQFYEEIAIFSEIKVFQKVNKNADVRFVSDDAMLPLYAPGEYVGGIRYFGEDIFHKALNTNCIVETKTGESFIRHLLKGRQPGLYTLVSLNANAHTANLVLYDTDLKSAAPIIWHRRVPLA